MRTELIIQANESNAVMSLLKDGRLVELVNEDAKQQFSVGDVYLGQARKLAASLNAAFIDVGYEKDAFLHYHDLGPQISSWLSFNKKVHLGKQSSNIADFELLPLIEKDGAMENTIKSGDEILVQVVKEPISTKGPRVTSEISIAGRFIVLVPFTDRISVSQKVRDRKEKDRLRKLIQSIRPKGFGVIVRTVAEGASMEDLKADLADLLKRWKILHRNLRNAKPRKCVLQEMDRASAYLRDVFNDSFDQIVVDDESLLNEIKEFIVSIAPEKASIVKLHNSAVPIFQQYGVDRQLKSAFGRTVNMGKGTYLIIEHTEAMHVIDVNSGNRSSKGEGQEENALAVNIMAAEEIGRQLRLRDMGGIICVDFIDMNSAENRKALFEKMKDVMSTDRARHKILPPSRFGLIEITRQRVRPAQRIQTKEENPDSLVEAPITMITALEQKFDQIASKMKSKGRNETIYLHVHPFIHAYLTSGFLWNRRFKKWSSSYGNRLEVVERDAFKMLEYRFADSKNRKLG
ncbi:MAG: Ribonuclease E [Owenweeksia sp. TMED14]|nr:MAG: Ribonuclease E [Owenweeksia sp. TMED14]